MSGQNRGIVSDAISKELETTLQAGTPFFTFLTRSEWSRRSGDEGICDFVTGEPHEMPLEGFVEALAKWSKPSNPHWFGYKTSERGARAIVAESLHARLGAEFSPDQIFMTNGAIAGLTVALRAVVDPGDEVIFLTPPWFGYEPMIEGRGALPVRVKLEPPVFDLDVRRVVAAVTERTRAIIINSPNNPTGRIYAKSALAELAAALDEASRRNGRAVYLISDEAYSKVLFDGNEFVSPATLYSRALLIYTYGKTLLTPGQRLGYIALAPGMPDAHEVGSAVFMSQIQTGWAFPNALLQHALGDLEKLSIDLAALQRKRDVMAEALLRFGYELTIPQGTFYLLVRSPIPDDMAFIDALARREIFVLPGSTMELPGYFRVSLTASMEMVERSLEGFEAALKEA
jgi:aspartate aminotransferase